MPRSMRVTSFDFDQSKYDSLLSDVEAITSDTLNGLSGLRTVRAVKTVSYTHLTLPTILLV